MKPPVDVQDRNDILARTRLMHDLIVLALKSDSTRVITYAAGGAGTVPKIEGVDTGRHKVSHHGQRMAGMTRRGVPKRGSLAAVAVAAAIALTSTRMPSPSSRRPSFATSA